MEQDWRANMNIKFNLVSAFLIVGMLLGQNAMAASFLDTLVGSYSVKKETCKLLNDESSQTMGKASIVKVEESVVVVVPILVGQLQTEYSNSFQPDNGSVHVSEGWEGDIIKSWIKRTVIWKTDESKLVAKKIEREVVGVVFKTTNVVESKLEVTSEAKNVRLTVDGISCELIRR